MNLFKKIKVLWSAFAQVFGQVQTTVLLSVVYHFAIGPVALVCKILRKDLLGLLPTQDPSYAASLPELANTPDRAKRQF